MDAPFAIDAPECLHYDVKQSVAFRVPNVQLLRPIVEAEISRFARITVSRVVNRYIHIVGRAALQAHQVAVIAELHVVGGVGGNFLHQPANVIVSFPVHSGTISSIPTVNP